MLFEQVTVIGVGLVGGSVGLAVRARNLAARVVGVGRDAKTLSRAVELKAIDSFTTDGAAGVRGADIVVVCTPVDCIAEVIAAAAPHAAPKAIFTDAGSTKDGLHDAVRKLTRQPVHFVPAHPIAGSEASGVEHARADLFEKRVTVLTPPADEATSDAVWRVEAFWRGLGSRVVRLPAAEHDRVLATTSHLPHAVAAGVAGVTPTDWLGLAGTGFRDVTRIAAGDATLWTAIFEANRGPVLAALRSFTERMAEFQRLLEAGDGPGLVRWLAEGKQVRDALGS